MSSIAARRANKRVCPLQPNGILSRGTPGILAQMPMEPPQLTVHNVIAEGDCVTAYGDMTMQDKDGAVVSYAYCDIYHFRGEKIVAVRAFVIPTAATSQTSPGAS